MTILAVGCGQVQPFSSSVGQVGPGGKDVFLDHKGS